MQNAAAMSTVSWISVSDAPAALASATCCLETRFPPSWTAPAMASRALSLSETGADSRSAHTCSTNVMPSGARTAANAAWV